MARRTSLCITGSLFLVPGFLLVLAAAVSSFAGCRKPTSGILASSNKSSSSENPISALGMDKETFAREFPKEFANVVKSVNACPSFNNPDKLLVLEQSKFLGFIPRGSRMDINTSEKRTIGSIDAPFGTAFAGRGNYYTYHMKNESGQVTSYARFKKTGLDDNFELDYMTPPEVEVYSCSVSEDALKNRADTGQLPIYRFRVNSVNGSRLIKVMFTFRTLRQLFAPVCGRSSKLRQVLGDSCDSLPILALAAVRNDKRIQLDPDAQSEDRVYVSMGLNKDRRIDSVLTVSKNAKSIRIRRLPKETDPSESPPDGVSSDEIKQVGDRLVGLWLPYFFRAEQHLESYNSNLDSALGVAADLTIGLLPGGKYLGEGVWKLAEEALSKGAESARQEKLQSNPNELKSSSPIP